MTTRDLAAPDSTAVTAPPAHHGPNGWFRNPWPNSEPRGWSDVMKWTLQRERSRLAATPARNSFPIAIPSVSYPRASDADFTATWVGHSTILLQLGVVNILTDPVFCERAFPVQWAGPRRIMDPALSLDKLPPRDIVDRSHTHYDHLDKNAMR